MPCNDAFVIVQLIHLRHFSFNFTISDIHLKCKHNINVDVPQQTMFTVFGYHKYSNNPQSS